ncbi:alpha/beta-hydrolase [Dichomitus squalens LYAD-421 SS1]|uniref:Alpha/beta-hydrolase n=1 Tax=Dichomitus squalens (strain LYAD-421) TaxID=732165 RepID=R7SS57_DICSQ|nr:alpha/beta-hydrolase [Dichomitus squalens LYAD-421 SS1]EJF57802.1 alpha/beta-hydrolase [Dichomitus squalens LYAD-421 SS1]
MPPTTVVTTPRSSDGTHIYAEAVGNPRNPHIVFLHEATLCGKVFDELFQDSRLTEHLYMVRYDLRCHGRSGTVRGATGQTSILYADDFVAVMSSFATLTCCALPSAAVVADICAHVSPPPIAGVVFVSPLPFLGTTMTQTATPRMVQVVQTLGTSRDAVELGRAKTEFVDGLFSGPARRIPDTTKAAWLGRSISQDPESTNNAICRTHDPTKLLEAGRRGLPLMVLIGSEDALVNSLAVVRELRRHFRNLEAYSIGGSSHALFIDRKDEFIQHLLMFVGRLAVSPHH